VGEGKGEKAVRNNNNNKNKKRILKEFEFESKPGKKVLDEEKVQWREKKTGKGKKVEE